MKENSEEDIKNIEEIIELSKKEIDAKDENMTAILDIEDLISLKHILLDYKRVLEINKVLLKENKRLKTKIDICNCQEKSCREIIESKYIPKEKIKELIKRKKENIEGLHPASDCVLIDDFETQIDVLKQLLEENNYDE